MVNTTAQLHSTKPELRFCARSNPACGCQRFAMVRISDSNSDWKCDQIRRFLRIWSYSLKKPFIENFIFCAVCLSSVKHTSKNNSSSISSDFVSVLMINFFVKRNFNEHQHILNSFHY